MAPGRPAPGPLSRLSADTVVYGTSTVISRFLTFLLVPYYTNVLAPGAYGIVGTTYTYIAFFSIIYGYGMEAAYFRFAADAAPNRAQDTFRTPFLALLLTSTVITLLLVLLPVPAAELINQHGSVASSEMATAVRLTGIVLFFDTLCLLPFAALRLEHKATRFASIKLVNVALQVGLNVVFLTVLHTGITGIFFGNAIAAAATFALLLPVAARALPVRFDRSLFRDMLRFGIPYLPSGISLMMLQVIDRPILQALTDDAHVGIYQANYRLGIVMMVFVSMFEYAWRPFFLQYASRPNARRVFALVLTVFAGVAGGLLLLVSFFVGDIARIPLGGRTIINAQYWGGLTIVPIVLAAYIFNGFYTNFIAGIYIEKRTRLLPIVTGIGAAVNIAANFAFIPVWGIAGAAWATFIAYAVMALALYLITRRIYEVPYEWGRIALILGATGVCFTAAALTATAGASEAPWWMRIALLLVYGAIAVAAVSPRRVRNVIAAEGHHD